MAAGKKEQLKETIATGRRKTAVASVRLRQGTGKVSINNLSIEQFFPVDTQRELLLAPLKKLDLASQYDLKIRVKGGGLTGQLMAIRLGLSRALVAEDEERRKDLKDEGFMTRDPRMKERKKYGRAKARKQFQFSKR